MIICSQLPGIILGGKGGRGLGLTLPPTCTDCLEIWKPQLPGTLRACTGLQWCCFMSRLHLPTPPAIFVPVTEFSLMMTVNVTAKHVQEIQ